MNSDIENKEELLALTTCSVCGSDSATSNQIDINKHMRELESELATLKATGFNVQDVVDWAKNTIHHKSKCGSHDCIYVDELINYLEKLDQASDNKDGEEND